MQQYIEQKLNILLGNQYFKHKFAISNQIILLNDFWEYLTYVFNNDLIFLRLGTIRILAILLILLSDDFHELLNDLEFEIQPFNELDRVFSHIKIDIKL